MRRGERGGTRDVLLGAENLDSPDSPVYSRPADKGRSHASARTRGTNFGSDLRRPAGRSGRRCEAGHPRHRRRHLGGRDRRDHRGGGVGAAQDRRSGPGVDLRHVRPCRRAQCGADQRHCVACARFRRLQQFARRSPVGADPAGAVGDRARVERQGIHRRLRRRRRMRDPVRPCRQFPSLREGLASDRDAGNVRQHGGLRPSPGAEPRADRYRAGARRVDGVGHQGQFRDHDQAVPCRAHDPQRLARGAAREGGHDGQRRRARTSAGLLRGLQRRRHLQGGASPRALGRPVRPRRSRHRVQASSLLRQHASCRRRDAASARDAQPVARACR